MRPTRKNYTNFYNGINADFGESVKKLFIGEYHGIKSTQMLIVKILLFAVCTAKSIFDACRINETPHSQFPKKLV